MFPPERIVCLTEETVETLYLLGEQDRIVGISGYVVRPPQARREKPRVSAFTSADTDKISALSPDLVLSFSDLQADIVADLVRRGIEVHAFNQRSVAGILDMIRLLGAMVGSERQSGTARCVADGAPRGSTSSPRAVGPVAEGVLRGVGRPVDLRNWVGLGAHRCGGRHRHLRRARKGRAAKDRIVALEEVVAREPDIVIGSWCGKKFRPERVTARPGFAKIPAVRHGAVYEIKSSIILQPGPAALTDGLAALQGIIERWAATR